MPRLPSLVYLFGLVERKAALAGFDWLRRAGSLLNARRRAVLHHNVQDAVPVWSSSAVAVVNLRGPELHSRFCHLTKEVLTLGVV